MTEQCPMCGKERADGQDYCLTSGCGWHFGSAIIVDPQSEHSYVQSEEKWEENKKEMEKEQEPSKSEPEFFKKRDEKASDDTFVKSDSQWEKERKEMEAEADATAPDYNAQIVDVNSSKDAPAQKTLLPPDFKMTTIISSLLPDSVMVSANFWRISPGSELLWGWKNSMVPILFTTSNFT